LFVPVRLTYKKKKGRGGQSGHAWQLSGGISCSAQYAATAPAADAAWTNCRQPPVSGQNACTIQRRRGATLVD
jgi:hypothetical protein